MFGAETTGLPKEVWQSAFVALDSMTVRHAAQYKRGLLACTCIPYKTTYSMTGMSPCVTTSGCHGNTMCDSIQNKTTYMRHAFMCCRDSAARRTCRHMQQQWTHRGLWSRYQ